MRLKQILTLGLSAICGGTAMGQVAATAQDPTTGTFEIRPDETGATADFYAEGNAMAPFEVYSIATFVLTKEDFGLAPGDTVSGVTAAEMILTHNDRSFTAGDEYELFVTLQNFGGDFSSLSYDTSLISGINPAQYASAPVSLGTFPYVATAPGLFLYNPSIDLSALEAEIVTAINNGDEINIVLGAIAADDAITLSGFENNFDPGDPTLQITVEADADNSAPSLVSTSPANGATEVPTDSLLSVTLDQFAAAGTGSIFIRDAIDDSVIEEIDVETGNVSIEDFTLTITPTNFLPELTEVYVEIPGAALTDEAGNAFGGTDGTNFAFETALGNSAPVFTATGPFSVSDQSLAGTVVGDIDVNDDGVTDGEARYSILNVEDASNMAQGLAGFNVDAIFTVGETIPGTSGALNSTTAGDYTPVGILDGIGAMELDASTVRIFVNHELLHFRGNSFEVPNGAGGTFTIDSGARVSYFDIDKASREIVDAGLAINQIYDANGVAVSDLSFQPDFLDGFSRFCSSTLIEAGQFGEGRGLEDPIYFTGEEDGSGFNSVGGAEWALDVTSGDFWQLPALGRGAWENVTEVDTGSADHVAFILADDSSPFNADEDPENEAAPMYLYVGEKDPEGDFPARNGLRNGSLYVWVADSGVTLPSQFNGAGSSEAGTWVAVDNSQNLAEASEDGSSGFDEFGYPTQSNLWSQAEALGAFGFSRPEDLATNPFNGSEFVLASTGVDNYDVDPVSGNGADTFGTVYTAVVEFDENANPTGATFSILYDGDEDLTRALRSPDNLDWADDGLIYVQEDEAEEDTLSGDEVLFGPGAANPNEAGIVQIDPATGDLLRVANVDRSVILDPSIDSPLAAFDGDAGDAGEWESSGILDVSTLFGEMPGTLFLFDVQAHGIADQEGVNAASRINDDDLVEGGQLLFLERKFDPMLEALANHASEAIFTVGSTLPSTHALSVDDSDTYTPPGILDGIGAYELDANTIRVFTNHELLHFRGNSYEVSDGAGGTFTIDSGARVSYFDIDKASRKVIDTGLAIKTIYDANGNAATDLSFLPDFVSGFSRFCSSTLIEPEQFGEGRGLADRIYFTGEEDGTGFNSVGGNEWALDVATGDFWQLPALGRGAWENVTEIDTGTTTHVAFILADDSSPFDFDDDEQDEATPLYLYVGEKDPEGDFPARNGLRGGSLYVWKTDSGATLPSQFRGAGATETGMWVEVDNTPNLAQASEDGSTGFDEFGYPTQGNLWIQAETLGAFGFSRPEDLATNPANGAEFVLASTGVDDYDILPDSGNGADTFGTIYTAVVDFDEDANPVSGTFSVLYDGDTDPARSLRSPDNLDWADDGLIYIQEDEAEEDTASGDEVLFGPGAVNPNEAGIVRIDPVGGWIERVANINRNVILDGSIIDPAAAVDVDAGDAGEWESSGILDVSSLFGEAPGSLFLVNVQAHGIEDQNNFNAGSRITDGDLSEGGQMLFFEIGAAEPTLNFADMFEINPNTGVITVNDPAELSSMGAPYVRITVEADDGLNPAVMEQVNIEVNDDPVIAPDQIRVATFNTSLNRNAEGQLVTDLSDPDNAQAQQIAEIIQRVNPDVILINEFDFDAADTALNLFRDNYLEVSQNGQAPVYYGYSFNAPSNTGVQSGFDFNNNDNIGDGNDGFGFGNFPGQFGMIVLSKYPIVEDQIRTFQRFLWKDMPGALLPADPEDSDDNGDFDNYYTAEELEVFRLSSKSHWDIPVLVDGVVVHALASHPTPPTFDGPEDRNGTRNHDEIRFWVDYVNGEGYIYDDFGQMGGLPQGTPFVILGDQNADPFDGDSFDGAANMLLNSPWTNISVTPSSLGGPEDALADGGDNDTHEGPAAHDTSDFGEPPGNLRVDYALPSNNLTIVDAQVFWPEVGQPGADLIGATDHRMVWVDVLTELEPGVFALAGDAALNVEVDGAEAAEGKLALVVVGPDGQPFDGSALEGVSDNGELAVGQTLGGFEIVGYVEVGPNGTVNVDGVSFDLQPGDANSIVSSGDQFGIVVFDNLLFEEDGSTSIATGSLEPHSLITDSQFLVQDGLQTFGDELDTVRATSFLLQILHASDLEGGVNAIERAPNFAAIVELLEDTNPDNADGTIILSAGDNYIPGPFFTASSDFALGDDLQLAYENLFGVSLSDPVEGSEIEVRNGAIDITIMNIIGFDASAIGNHEFDLGVEIFRDLLEEEYDTDRVDPSDNIVPAEIEWHGTQFPYLSANLDFSGEPDLDGIFTSEILTGADFTNTTNEAIIPKFPVSQGDSTRIAPAVILDVAGEPVGVVGGTTQRVTQISSTGGVTVKGEVNDNDIPLLASQLQPVIDDIIDGANDTPGDSDDVNKVVLVTHLQQLALEQQLASLLTGVDVIIAGGSDTLLADDNDDLRDGDTAAGEYPSIVRGLDGNNVLIVSTDGEYSYVGRLNVPFDENGVVNVFGLDSMINGPISTEPAVVADLWAPNDPFTAGSRGSEVMALVNEVTNIVNTQDSNIFGYTAFYLAGDRELVRTEETNLGSLAADSILWKARQDDPSVVIGFRNGGGLRNPIGEIDPVSGATLPPQGNPDPDVMKPVGAISELDIADVMRFNNSLVTFDLSGQDILEVLEHGFGASFEGTTQGRFPQIAGLQVAYTPPVDVNGNGSFDDGVDTPVEIRSFALMGLNGRVSRVLYKDGEFLDGAETEEFTITTLNFLADFGNFGVEGATAGDGYPFPGLGENLVYLMEGEENVGEQQALQEYLAAFFGAPEFAFSQPEMPVMQDARIQNLDVRFDTVGSDIPVIPAGALRLTPLASFASGVFDESATEIVTYDPATQRLFAVSSAPGEAIIRVIDASDPFSGLPQIGSIAAPFPNFEPNSVDFFSGPLGNAVAVAWSDESGVAGKGSVTLHDPATLAMIGSPIEAGFLPDMLTFTPDGNKIVVANEGEVVGVTNPEGSVSIIEFTGDYATAAHTEVSFARWNARESVLRARGVLLTQVDVGEAANVAEDLEPEYVAVTPDSEYAWVVLQENNAVALVDLVRGAVRNIQPLGTVNFNNVPLDASDRDGGDDNEPINVTNEPVFGLRQPDAIAMVEFEGENYLLTANEGDARDFEEIRFKDIGDGEETTYTIDSEVAAELSPLQENAELGRLEINQVASDLDRDGDIDAIVTFGGRSMSTFHAPVIGRFRAMGGTSMNGNNDMDEFTASIFSTVFHVSNDDNTLPDELENRSDAKGVEPEAITIGEIDGVKYAFLGLERQSGIMVYDVTDPRQPVFHAYVSNRNFMVDADSPEAGDLGPEAIEFIPAGDSPTGKAMIAVSNEVSGTVTLWEIDLGLQQ